MHTKTAMQDLNNGARHRLVSGEEILLRMVGWNFYINNPPIFHSFSINFSKSDTEKQLSSPGVTTLKTLTVVKVSVNISGKASASQRPS